VPERLSTPFFPLVAWTVLVCTLVMNGTSVAVEQQGAASKESSDQGTQATKTPDGAAAGKKKTGRASAAAKKKADRAGASKNAPAKATGLEMAPPIVCRSIDGFEDYKPLPGAAQTSDEKLLVYIRPTGYHTEKVEKGYQSHLTADGEVRRRGEKKVLRQKKKLLEYKPVYETPERVIYLKQSVSLKGLEPGDYELTIILHDELAKGATATRVVKFKIIPPLDPRKVKEPPEPHELDTLYSPFMDFDVPDPDDE
jgi:hypothetical protein